MSDNVRIVVEDDRTGMSPDALRRAVLDHLMVTRAKDLESATLLDLYHAVSYAVRDRLVHRWIRTQKTYAEHDVKRVYYLSAEYLMGRQLGANLLVLGVADLARVGLKAYGLDLEQILDEENDPGLGNGGLGRLAACFVDSLATLDYPATGYGIRYEFGIFRQGIEEGWQVEHPDAWLRHGNPWEIARPEYTVPVRFGGHTERIPDANGFHVHWVGGETVLGVPYDTPVAGFRTNTVNNLRLWSARASEDFDLAVFNDGDYRRAVEQKSLSESISKVLYPRDDSPEGRELRFKQQYFFVACSLHDIVRRWRGDHTDWNTFADKVAIQLNDTHPAIAIPELMRLLLDHHGMGWDAAWAQCTRVFGYTNHTLLPEALEKWPVPLFEKLLPRHLEIIYEINHRFLREVHLWAPQDHDRKRRMSLVEEGPVKQIRMAHLSVVGSHAVNGVAALHSDLLRKVVLKDFAEMWPDRFGNVTNGVTPRRWLLQCNPRLAAVITARIGDGWVKDLSRLEGLLPLANDAAFQADLAAIKMANKQDLAGWIGHHLHQKVDPASLFDVQVKRIHEYKRQILVCLHVVHLYARMRFHGEDIVPRTVLIGGKAAPGYARAKRHIKLITDVARLVADDPVVRGRLKMLFLPNYDVSLAERVIPAAELSEQISTAGKEASGTGNMKFQMNGALTIGTLDGANVEIREEVGADHFFLFGLDVAGVEKIKAQGYDPEAFIARSPDLQEALDLVESGFFSPDEPDRHAGTARHLREDDPFLVCADFDAYVAAQRKAGAAWTDPATWGPSVVRNIAKSGKFSSDRSIREYAERIWGLSPCPVVIEPYVQP